MNEQTTINEQQAMTVSIVEYSATAAAIAALRAKFKGVIFPVDTTTGMKDAITARKELRDIRVGLEKVRKDIKAPALKLCQDIDSEAKAITAQLVKLEDPIDEQIKAEEARKEREKQERERIERERVAGIKAKIEAIRRIPVELSGQPAAMLAEELDEIRAFQPSEEFAEFAEEASATVATVIETVTAMHERQAAQEAEAERLAAERDEQERIAREAREADEARLRAEREAFEAERRRFEEERAAAQDKEQQATKQQAVIAPTTDDNFGVNVSISSDEEDQKNRDVRRRFDAVLAIGDHHTAIHTAEEFVPEAQQDDADAIVRELAGYTSMQFQALANKVKAAGFAELYAELIQASARLATGEFDDAIKAGNWMAMADADKEMALASHACVSLVVGDGEMGASILRGVAA